MKTSATRRNFMKRSLKYGALVSAGAAGAVSGMTALSPKNLFAKTATTYEWPWPYAKLDPESGRKLGHDAYWSGKGCSYAAFHAIVSALQKKIGAPYDGLPAEIMIYGHGGGAGWGMLCGALNGPAAAISLVCDKKTSDLLINELFGWYSQAFLPTDLSNQYAVDKKYGVNKYDQEIKPCKSGSPMCHVSATKWCNEAYVEITQVERKERCARMTGDSVAFAIQILNDYHDNRFKSVYVEPESIAACVSCHGKDGEKVDTSSKMNCVQCHGDSHQDA